MQLDHLTANIRPLPAYQALDLGQVMARAWFSELWRLWWRNPLLWLWFGIVLVVAVLVHWQQLSLVAMNYLLLILWLIKPVFELRLLYYLSQKLFDDDYHPSVVKLSTWRMLPALLWRRLSTRRTVMMAIYLLEGGRGRALSKRMTVLGRGSVRALSAQAWLFFMLLLLLTTVGWFMLDMLFKLSPIAMTSGNNGFFDDTLIGTLVMVLLVVLVESILAPFFVAGGFAVYVCRRSKLEGWDIELSFRGLQARFLAQKSPTRRYND